MEEEMEEEMEGGDGGRRWREEGETSSDLMIIVTLNLRRLVRRLPPPSLGAALWE